LLAQTLEKVSTDTIYYTATPASALEVPYQENIDQKIDRYALEYKVLAEVMRKVIACESAFNEKAWNKSDPYGGAKGIGQFLQPTFDAYSKKAGIENGDIWNVDHQLQTMAYMFSIKEQRQWVCFRQLPSSEG
jgi:hypothetical protein